MKMPDKDFCGGEDARIRFVAEGLWISAVCIGSASYCEYCDFDRHRLTPSTNPSTPHPAKNSAETIAIVVQNAASMALPSPVTTLEPPHRPGLDCRRRAVAPAGMTQELVCHHRIFSHA